LPRDLPISYKGMAPAMNDLLALTAVGFVNITCRWSCDFRKGARWVIVELQVSHVGGVHCLVGDLK
jgi:hypothetical protein